MMGAQRQRAYEAAEKEAKRPDFLPFPFRVSVDNGDGKKKAIYVYINAIKQPYYSMAVRRMRGSARGLNRVSNILENVANNGNDDDRQ
jgi:hypothetical protein